MSFSIQYLYIAESFSQYTLTCSSHPSNNPHPISVTLAGILTVVGYFVMLFMILNIAKETDTLRNSILAYGIFAYLFLNYLWKY